jgi:predicted nuclease of predicted toxin-antitoxin system
MLRLVSDEDVDGYVLRELLRREPGLDIVRVQDVGLMSAPDPDILAWAATEGRIVLTQDHATMPDFAYDRVRAGLPMPGVFVIRNQPLSIGRLAQEILTVALCSAQEEWKDQVVFLPL